MMRKRGFPRRRLYAIIYYGKHKYLMQKTKINIGRTSYAKNIDIQLSESSVISRCHITLYWVNGKIYLKCVGKNGVFINDKFKNNRNILYGLPNRCHMRFPSTSLEMNVNCLPKSYKERLDEQNTMLAMTKYVATDNFQSNAEEAGENKKVQEDAAQTKLRDLKEPPSVHLSRRKQLLTTSHNRPAAVSQTKESNQRFKSADMLTSVVSNVDVIPSVTTSIWNQNPTATGLYSTSTLVWGVSDGYIINGGANTTSGTTAFATISSAKPPYSFAQLIVQALASQPSRRLTLSGIYSFISQSYPFYQLEDKGWQNSIRHNLSLNKHFYKAPRTQDEPGKGCFWKMDPQFEERLITQAYRRRRPRQHCDMTEFVAYQQLPTVVPVNTTAINALVHHSWPIASVAAVPSMTLHSTTQANNNLTSKFVSSTMSLQSANLKQLAVNQNPIAINTLPPSASSNLRHIILLKRNDHISNTPSFL